MTKRKHNLDLKHYDLMDFVLSGVITSKQLELILQSRKERTRPYLWKRITSWLYTDNQEQETS